MVDFKKLLEEGRERRARASSARPEPRKRDDFDPRAAAEVMSEEFVIPPGPRCPAGPRASQVFNAEVMRQQVDPR